MTIIPKKRCNKCGHSLPLSYFSPHKQMKDGLKGTCKPCVNRRRRELYDNPASLEKRTIQERAQEYKREIAWYRKNYPQPTKPWNDPPTTPARQNLPPEIIELKEVLQRQPITDTTY